MTHETSKTILISISACVIGLLLGAAGVAYVFYTQHSDTATVQKNTNSIPPPLLELAKQTTQEVTLLWLPTPIVLPEDLKLFSYTEEEKGNFSGGDPKVKYYKTGVDGSSDILIAEIPVDGPCMYICAQLAYIMKTEKGYSLLQKSHRIFLNLTGSTTAPHSTLS